MDYEKPSWSALRKRREQQDTTQGSLRAILLFIAVSIIAVLRWFYGTKDAEEAAAAAAIREATRILRNDGLEATDENVNAATQLIAAATRPYDENEFNIVTVSSISTSSRTHRLLDDHNVSMVSLEQQRAKLWVIEDFVSEREASDLLEAVSELDFVASPTNHQEGQDWRSSSSAVASNISAFRILVRRAAALCKVPLSYVEDPQVVRYRPGEKYQPHLDSSGPAHRHWTLLLYLNDPGGGGATAFPLLNMKVMPLPQHAAFWENLRHDSASDIVVRNYYTLHDGQAPTGQEAKYAVNIWVRNAPYKLDL